MNTVRRAGSLTLGLVGIAAALLLGLFLLGMIIQINNGVASLAESGTPHGGGWWIKRVLVGLLAFAVLIGVWTFVASIFTGLVNGAFFLIGTGIYRVARPQTPRPLLAIRAANTLNGSKTLFGLFLGIGLFWYCVISPFATIVPTIAFGLALAVLLLMWAPSVAFFAFALRTLPEGD